MGNNERQAFSIKTLSQKAEILSGFLAHRKNYTPNKQHKNKYISTAGSIELNINYI